MGFMDDLKGRFGDLASGATHEASLASGVMQLVNEHPGGLPAIVSAFEQQGLGAAVRSWMLNQPAPEPSPQQVEQVFGRDRLQAVAQRFHLDASQVATQVARALPLVLHHLAPHEQAPPATH